MPEEKMPYLTGTASHDKNPDILAKIRKPHASVRFSIYKYLFFFQTFFESLGDRFEEIAHDASSVKLHFDSSRKT